MAEPITGAEYFARSLAANGTTHVFFIDAVLRRTLIHLGNLGVTRVLGHSEKAVAYMADGYARIAGRPGICFAQSVGAANLASGLQDAYLANNPVIALTGRKPPSMQNRNAYQEIAHQPMFSSVTKFSAFCENAADFPRILRQAWRETMTGAPGPAHIDLNGLQADLVETSLVDAVPGVEPVFQTSLPPHRPTAAETEIDRAATALRAAKKVAIVAGTGAMQSKAGKELLALAEVLGAPIATSLGARGIVPTRHRLAVGCAGSYSAPPANQIVHAADLVLFVGCHTGDQVTHTWRIPAIDTPCIQIDIDASELGRSYPNTLGLMGDPKATLAKLVDAVGKGARDTSFGDWAAGVMAAWRAERSPFLSNNSVPIWPDRLCDEITRALPHDGILVADTGNSSIWSSALVELNGEGHTYLRAAGSLGWSFPAALGAKCAAPNRKVVCWSGDGALYYHLPELETAKRRGIAVTLIVNNNSGFGQSWPGIQRLQGNQPGDPRDLGRFGPTNFADVARTFGLRGIRVEEPSQLGPALRDAIASDETVVVDVATDIDCGTPTPWLPAGA